MEFISSASHTHGQPPNIDAGINLVFNEVTQSDFEVVFEHARMILLESIGQFSCQGIMGFFINDLWWICETAIVHL